MTGAAAPVAQHALALVDGRILGQAAPTSGRLPCVLRLEADGEPIAIARATRFDADAAVLGRRLGWCGVVLEVPDEAAALADTVSVRCVASGRHLLRFEVPPPAPRRAGPPLTVEALVRHVRQDDTCDDPATILPFAEASLRRHGLAGLLDATYRTLLGRPADPWVAAEWEARPPESPAQAALAMILAAPEYRGNPLRFTPGPFHPTFAFDLSPLGR